MAHRSRSPRLTDCGSLGFAFERPRQSASQPNQPITLEANQVIVSTTNFIAGHHVVETKGQVFGVVVRSRGLGGNIIAALRSLGGGEIHEYTSLLEDTRRQAVDRMVQNATAMAANAIL